MSTTASAVDVAASMDGTETRLFTALLVVLCLAWFFVLLRAYVRIFLVKTVASDDWWMFASMVAYTGYSIDGFYGIVVGGSGRHVTDLTLNEIYVGLKTWYISEIMYGPVSAMVRTSVALFLLRVSVERVHRWIIITNLTIYWIISAVFLTFVTFQCNPPNYFYDQVLGLKGSCMDIDVIPNVTIVHSVIGAVCDIVFALLPIAMLWNVQLNKRAKVVVAVLLGMGMVAGIALLVRIPYIKVLAISPDFLFETTDVAIWSVMEPSLGIIAGCVATLRPLFKGFHFGTLRTLGNVTGRSRRTAGTSTSGRQRTNNTTTTNNHHHHFDSDETTLTFNKLTSSSHATTPDGGVLVHGELPISWPLSRQPLGTPDEEETKWGASTMYAVEEVEMREQQDLLNVASAGVVVTNTSSDARRKR